MAKVFLDAGHGGYDPGVVGNGIQEKDISLQVTMKIGEILKKHGVQVFYSRTTDKFINLADRATMANKNKVDVFVSIHCNSATNAQAKGVEVYSYPNSTQGSTLANDIRTSIITGKVYTVDRGNKTANFAVLRLTNMPATLVELAFISNKEDSQILKNRQDELALGIAKGILKNLNISYKEDKKDNIDKKEESKLYRVQVGAFKDKKNAEDLVNKLKEEGFEATIIIN